MAKADRSTVLTRPAYSEESRRLAEELGKKAAANLRRAGYEVERTEDGTWKILSRPKGTR